MSDRLTNQPVWRQGMFMRPQHFQQFGRHIDQQIHARTAPLRPAGWGLVSIALDRSVLPLGKFAVQRCSAVMPDGTVIAIPEEANPPAPLDVPPDTREKRVLLCIPLTIGDGIAVGTENPRLRYAPVDLPVRDVTLSNSERETVTVQSLNCHLALEGEEPADCVTLPIARILDARSGVTLDADYIPPILDIHVSPTILSFVNEFESLLRSRGKALAAEGDPLRSQNHAAAFIEFMMLQTVNRHLPLLAHFGRFAGTHPETLYRALLLLAGDASVFLTPDRLPPDFPPYDHLQLRDCLLPLLRSVRAALISFGEQAAVSLPLQASRFGIWLSPITDRNLLEDARFILSVGADLHPEALRSRAPHQIKLGPVEQIRDLTQLQLPGIRLVPLPVVPRELPYRSEAVYLQLDKGSPAWNNLKTSAAFALHISGDYPGLRIEFWAIRDHRS